MQIEFEELGSQRTFALPELQARADGNPWSEARRQYRVQRNKQEVAYLSFDVFLPSEINLYEIFVAAQYRGQGIGCACILFAIDLGKQMGKERLSVRPEPLSEQSKEDLIEWYLRRGFVSKKGESGFLVLGLRSKENR